LQKLYFLIQPAPCCREDGWEGTGKAAVQRNRGTSHGRGVGWRSPGTDRSCREMLFNTAI